MHTGLRVSELVRSIRLCSTWRPAIGAEPRRRRVDASVSGPVPVQAIPRRHGPLEQPGEVEEAA
jgi:hypothetical protein